MGSSTDVSSSDVGDSDGRRPAMWAAAMRGAVGTLVASACFVGTVLHGLCVGVEVTCLGR